MLILASSSPRRKEILAKTGLDFTVFSPDVDERLLDNSLPPSNLAKEEARLKCYAVKALYPDAEVLAADTVVVLDGKALGKPLTEENAVRMLMEQSGKKEKVLTAYHYLGKGKEIARTVVSTVVFRPFSEEEARSYVEKKKPLDKAGGYGIQDDSGLIERLEGSYYNVMGLPLEDLLRHVFPEKE